MHQIKNRQPQTPGFLHQYPVGRQKKKHGVQILGRGGKTGAKTGKTGLKPGGERKKTKTPVFLPVNRKVTANGNRLPGQRRPGCPCHAQIKPPHQKKVKPDIA